MLTHILSPLSEYSSPAQHRMPHAIYYILLVAATILFSLLVYGLLPSIGLDMSAKWLSPPVFWAAGLLCLAVGMYWAYLELLEHNPACLFIGATLGMPWLDFISKTLIDNGVNTYESAWLFVLFLFPAFYKLMKRVNYIFRQIPATPYLAVHITLLLIYFIFFQYPIYDQIANPGNFTLGFYFLFNQIFQTCICLSCLCLIHKRSEYEHFFSRYSTLTIFNTLIISLIAIIAYQFNLFTISDGPIQRSQSIFCHPSYYGNYMALTLLFLSGILTYRLNHIQQKERSWIWWSIIAMLVGFVALFLSFSKAALFGFTCSLTVFLLLNFSFKQIKRKILLLLFIPFFLLGGLLAYQNYSGANVIDDLSYRMEDRGSLEWREKVSSYLLYEITPASFTFGNGMSAGKATLFQLEHRSYDRYNPGQFITVVQVHNSYLALWYDYGLFGLIPYLLIVWLLILTLGRLIRRQMSTTSRPLYATMVALIIYFLIVSVSETVIEVLVIPFWCLLTILYGMTRSIESKSIRPFNAMLEQSEQIAR